MLRSGPRRKFTMPDTRVADVMKESGKHSAAQYDLPSRLSQEERKRGRAISLSRACAPGKLQHKGEAP